ncbi:DNA mismatch repair protein MutL [Alicyclobacillus cellulosilyticus]|uniref:DNA mismatch repair protein MutL n=1 Tax=Alicyclobacillus cellulosilyticus TaxID=1003997 RepID=A0A917K891_9BACL|nr:DNA mismatch repair endonuclease MutL [Alicyclobacillus cellulosilyticus]GGJ04317.1 DNA mismatch repair protein MutL [Alicyclobacillus cellulosilyticus]
MGRIRVLPEALANLIAAGEVVERPASCVKELIENSLDAGARSVRVSLVDGGITGIVVQDDGCGMDAEDATLAFARHATSKVRSARDLYHIRTLGFRGEALASIAAVADVTLRTREPGAEAGVEVHVAGGVIDPPKPVGIPPGTRVEVRSLFYNTPARLKYLKSVAAEQARCVEVVQRAAVSRPDVSFWCEANGHVVFRTSGRGDLREVLSVLFGVGEAQQFLEVRAETADYRLYGYIGRPAQARARRAQAYWTVNGRPIRSPLLHQAVVDGYGGRLLVQHHPVYALAIDLDAALVDVNIHPHKTEVRFSEEADVCRMVTRAVREALAQANLAPGLVASVRPPAPEGRAGQEEAVFSPRLFHGGDAGSGGGAGARRLHDAPFVVREARGRLALDAMRPPNAEEEEAPQPAAAADADRWAPPHPTGERDRAEVATDAAPVTDRPRLMLRPVGQVLDTYIVAQDGEHLYIIDQHAAHERVLFERFRARLAAETVRTVPLIVPVSLGVTPAQASLVSAHAGLLARLGIVIEELGGQHVVLREVPDVWEGLDYVRLAEEVVAALEEAQGASDLPGTLRHALATRACKAAVKARQTLNRAEMEALCAALAAAEDPFHCPHGRPVLLRMSQRDLEKAFRRIV